MIDLRKQQAFDFDPKPFLFITEEAKETISDFSQGTLIEL